MLTLSSLAYAGALGVFALRPVAAGGRLALSGKESFRRKAAVGWNRRLGDSWPRHGGCGKPTSM